MDSSVSVDSDTDSAEVSGGRSSGIRIFLDTIYTLYLHDRDTGEHVSVSLISHFFSQHPGSGLLGIHANGRVSRPRG